MTELRARFRAYYIVNLLWLPTVLIVIGLWILGSEPSADWAAAAIAMLGLAAGVLYMLRRAIARFGGAAMTVDHKGVDHWTWGRIPWQDIESVELVKSMPAFSFVYMLKVKVNNPEVYLGNVSGIERFLRTRSFKKDFGPIELLLNGLTERPERIAEVAAAHIESFKGRQ